MIVLDASVVISAALHAGSSPERALLHTASSNRIALSAELHDEVAGVLDRSKFASKITAARRALILRVLGDGAAWFTPVTRVTDCRDAKDNRYLELVIAAQATLLISGDSDLLVLNPWRGVQIMTPRAYLDSVGAG